MALSTLSERENTKKHRLRLSSMTLSWWDRRLRIMIALTARTVWSVLCDVRTGELRWKWDPIPANLAPTGAGNAWSVISVDAARDLVFVPTGAPSPDYHGAKRPGDDKWANSLVALRGKDGGFVWGFQLV